MTVTVGFSHYNGIGEKKQKLENYEIKITKIFLTS
jgi:hypothetical protein